MPWAVDGGGRAPADVPLARAAPRVFAPRVFGRDGEGEAGRGRGGDWEAPAGGWGGGGGGGGGSGGDDDDDGNHEDDDPFANAPLRNPGRPGGVPPLPPDGRGRPRDVWLPPRAPQGADPPPGVDVPPNPHTALGELVVLARRSATATADESQARLIEAQNARRALELQQPAGAHHRIWMSLYAILSGIVGIAYRRRAWVLFCDWSDFRSRSLGFAARRAGVWDPCPTSESCPASRTQPAIPRSLRKCGFAQAISLIHTAM